MDANKENHLNIKAWKLILAVLLVNVTGLILRYFNLSTYIIVIGFRFHLSFVLPFMVVFHSYYLPDIKRYFLKPEWKKVSFYLLLILLPLIIETAVLYIFQKIDLGDPEYFYEFGISSIADYPLYLIWNFPQMILLFFFLVTVSSNSRYQFITVALVIILLFAFELVPITKSIILYKELGILISCSIIFSIVINYYRNIYLFGISLFTLFWMAILLFGSNSKTMINLLFASQYDYWEGFGEVVKDYMPYTVPIYFGIALIFSCIYCLIFRNRKPISANQS
jgi:hypothetical protein